MAEVVIYTRDFCYYSDAARDLLTRKGVAFKEINATGNRELRSEMIERANGGSTFPQIFIGDDPCGRLRRSLRARGSRQARCAACGLRGAGSMNGVSTFRVGLIQMRSCRTPQANIDAAARLIGEAKTGGADYVQTPEMTNIMEMSREKLFAAIVPEENDATLATFRELARALGIFVHVGSLAVKASADKAVNRSFLIDRRGEIVARYDKIHMFDVDLKGGESYRESRSYRPGELAVVSDLPWGRLGLTICYDLRFPALYRALAEAGATFLAIPSAFTRQTGEAHWHVLMRARAIENGSFVFAAAQGGDHENGRATFGHSLVVDPWGRVIAEGGSEPGVIFADVDPAEVATARARVPSLQHGRRFEILEPMAEPAHLHVVGGDA